MENEEDVLDWMVGQKMDETIELIDRETLFQYIGSKDFLAVVFCKNIFFYFKLKNYFNLLFFVFKSMRKIHKHLGFSGILN